MISAEFETAIPVTGRLRTYALDQTATGIGQQKMFLDIKCAYNRLYNYCTKYLEN